MSSEYEAQNELHKAPLSFIWLAVIRERKRSKEPIILVNGQKTARGIVPCKHHPSGQ